MGKKKKYTLDDFSNNITHVVGTNGSIVAHTIFFIGIFGLSFFGVALDQILLILTTAVSLEAIYLAIFIQMTVNRTKVSLANVEEDIDDIQENVDDLQEDVDDIQENVDDIQEDVDSLETNIKEISDDYIDDSEETEVVSALKDIEKRLRDLQGDIEILKKKGLF